MSEYCKFPISGNHLPPWEVLNLVSHYLDPKTLAIASCVCKSWSVSMSSEHLWKPICLTLFPSLSSLTLADPNISYSHLYSLAHQSTKRPHPCPPRISLDDLFFTIDIFNGSSCSLSLANSGKDLGNYQHGVFRFELDVKGTEIVPFELSKEMKVKSVVVLKGWRGMFSMMDCKGKGKLVSSSDGEQWWFMEDLPPPRCCLNAGAGGLVAELGLQFSSDTNMRVEKLRMGILNVGSCRFLSIEDGLRYLQHFLLP